jgi:Na+/pantothenate symporter
MAVLKRLSYAVTVLVGVLAFFGALRPPQFLQTIIVFSTEGLGVSLLAPVFLGMLWSRATKAGALAGMLGGVLCHLIFYSLGYIPLLWSLSTAFALAFGVSLFTRPVGAATAQRYFFTARER